MARTKSKQTPAQTAQRRKPARENVKAAVTKQKLVINLLRRKTGATVEEIVDATGWQAHSVRGAISGTLKKKLGLDVTSEKVDGRGRVYRIADHN